MPYRLYALCLWPGLPRLWLRGDLQAWFPAFAMAVGFNGLLLLRYIYPEWISPQVRFIGWILVLVWMVAVVRGCRVLPILVAPRRALGIKDHFETAQRAFLQGNWIEAEKWLRENLRVETRDAPSLLMLAAVYRQTARLELARQTLDLLGSLEVGDAWYLEARAERQRLQRASA